MASQSDLYQSVTDRIVAALEAGTAPWVRPWKSDRSGGSMPDGTLSVQVYRCDAGVSVEVANAGE